jgi:catechol 2,3-dioxygenase-like lactoylglutathione lyase family enzyme
VKIDALDHVALWVADRDTLADFLTDGLGMHVIDRTEKFTLVGWDARRGKLTLFAAEGPREPGVLGRVVLGVEDVDAALRGLPEDLAVERDDDGSASFTAPEDLGLGLARSERPGDIDRVVLRVPDPDSTFAQLATLGFGANNGTLDAVNASLALERADVGEGEGERPLLNHVALLVESAQEHIDEARRRSLEIADVVDAPNTYAVFVWGPDRIKLEYVEHKPGFSLV